MAKPSGLEVCVRNRQGRFVVPCQPVEVLLDAISALEVEVYRDGQLGTRQDSQDVRAAQRVVLKLLGLEPLPGPMPEMGAPCDQP